MSKTKLRVPRGAIAWVCLVAGTPAAATIITVTPSTLVRAFSTAKGGDTLKLVGTFAGARLTNSSFAKLVTLDLSGATFTDMLELSNTNNVTVSGGKFNLAGDAAWTKGVLVSGGRNVYVTGVTVTGSGTQWGVSVVGAGNVQVTNGNFSRLNAAVLFGSATNGLAGHNIITGAEADGIDIANSHGITASYNSCSAGLPGAGVHPDCIQLWSVDGNPLQSDITVTNNQATGPTQGFTSFAAGGGGLRINLLSNVVNTSFSQGVACYDCLNSVIANNRVSTLAGSTYQTVVNVIGGSGNSVYGNAVATYRPAANTMAVADAFVTVADNGGTTTMDMLTQLIKASGAAPASVPEPSAWALLLAGFAAVGAARRRSTARAAGRDGRRMA